MSNELLQALHLLKSKQWVDLTHTFGPDSPHFFMFEDAKFETLFSHDDGFFAQQFSFPGQYGTHIDPPIHFVRDTRFLDELALKELVLPLIVIDKSQEAASNHDFTLSVQDILESRHTMDRLKKVHLWHCEQIGVSVGQIKRHLVIKMSMEIIISQVGAWRPYNFYSRNVK